MSILDQRADNWFGVCEEFVAGEFGKNVQFRRSPHGTHLNATLCVQDGGDDIRCFNVGERTWDNMEDDDIHVSIGHDGAVSVGYGLEDQIELGMNFKVGHPREVSELFHLLLNPAAYVKPDEECSYEEQRLGDLVEFRMLIPDGDTWRTVDPSALPAGTPNGFRMSLYAYLTLDVDLMSSGPKFEPCRYADQWPDFVKSLPAAAPEAREGYILDLHVGTMKSAVDFAAFPPTGNEIELNVLIIPRSHAVSSFYLREAITGDKSLGKKLLKAFLAGGDLDEWTTAIKAFSIRLPVDVWPQVRLAAEQNAMRQWLLFMAEQVATQGGSYFQAERNWHLAHTLSRMLDHTV